MTIAVAAPCATRALISSTDSCARPPTRDETPSRAIPSRNSRRRPNRSAILPKNQGEARRTQRERGRDPLQVIQGEPDVRADRGEGDIEDREVHRKGEARCEQDGEGEALAAHHTASAGWLIAEVRGRNGVRVEGRGSRVDTMVLRFEESWKPDVLGCVIGTRYHSQAPGKVQPDP